MLNAAFLLSGAPYDQAGQTLSFYAGILVIIIGLPFFITGLVKSNKLIRENAETGVNLERQIKGRKRMVIFYILCVIVDIIIMLVGRYSPYAGLAGLAAALVLFVIMIICRSEATLPINMVGPKK